jgi:dihydroorotase
LSDGAVDAIATDHAPHHQDEKDDDFDSAPFGIVGLETAVAICLDRLVRPGILTLPRMVALLSGGPARILKVEGGTLAPGSRADVTLLDLERPFRVEPQAFLSKGRNTPFAGWELKGRAVRTIVGGKTVWALD